MRRVTRAWAAVPAPQSPFTAKCTEGAGAAGAATAGANAHAAPHSAAARLRVALLHAAGQVVGPLAQARAGLVERGRGIVAAGGDRGCLG